MSEFNESVVEDGRRPEDMKVVELKKELEKRGMRRTGGKAELVARLLQALKESPPAADVELNVNTSDILQKEDAPVYNKSDFIESPVTLAYEKIPKQVYQKRNFKVDLDDSDDMRPEYNETNQSFDTLELGAPIDDSLNPLDDTSQEDQIEINLSKDEEADMNLEVTLIEKQLEVDKTDLYTSSKSETIPETYEYKVDETSDLKIKSIENDVDDMLNIELETPIEMYEGDNNELDMEDCPSKEEIETITVTVKNEVNITNDDAKEETEDGEVITIPITARLGKRKVTGERDTSPKKLKKKGLRETKGSGHIIEEPLRVKSPQKSKNIISDILRIDNLVRPFTMTQLQDVFSIKGKVMDLWLNKIKSIAYVRYENESIAINARESLDGCKWPSINPKLLVADFATYKEMEWMKENGDSGVNLPAYLRQQEKLIKDIEPIVWRDVEKHKENERPNRDERQIKDVKQKIDERQGKDENLSSIERLNRDERQSNDERQNKDQRQNRAERPNRTERQNRDDHQNRNERQIWDDRQKYENHKRKRSNSMDKRRRLISDKKEDITQKKNVGAPPPVKLLEDLFRKTIALPAIYWLPVSKEIPNPSKEHSGDWRNVNSL